MLRDRVAILAVTLLCCKWFPRQSTSFIVTERISPLRLGRRSRPNERCPAVTTPATGVVFVIAKQALTGEAEDFGSHYPQTGKFGSQHKAGSTPATPAAATAACEREEADESWSTALAALAASGTALALQTDPAVDPSSEELDSGDEDRLDERNRAQRYRHLWRDRPRQDPNQRGLDDVLSRTGTGTGPFMLSSLLQRLQTEVSSNADALSSWTSKRCSQLRDVAAVAAAATTTTTHRSLLFSHQSVRELHRAGGQVVNCAARGAQSGLDQLTWRLSGATDEAGRRAEALLSAARTSRKKGFRLIGVGLARCDLRRGGWRRRARGGGDSTGGKEEGEYEGSRLARLTDLTVQNVVDVVARDGWEHVTTTSGVVVHRQYIALGPDGTPAPPTTVEGGATGAGAAEEVSATGTAAASGALAGAGARARGERANAGVEVGVGAGAGASGVTPVGRTTPASTGRRRGISTTPTPDALLVGGGRGVERREADAGKGSAQFACVKATAVLSVPPEVVYLLFADNSRVSEYNEHCREVMDLEILSEDSKITWAASGRMGPFKVRRRGGGCEGSTSGISKKGGGWEQERGAGGQEEGVRLFCGKCRRAGGA